MNYDVQKLARSQRRRASDDTIMPTLCVYLATSDSPPGRAFTRGCRALTTIVMLGLKSASYWTHSAATAASCTEAHHRTGSQFTREMLAQRKWGNAVRVQTSTAAYLGHGFWRVVVLELGIHALLHFVLAQSRSGLDMPEIC